MIKKIFRLLNTIDLIKCVWTKKNKVIKISSQDLGHSSRAYHRPSHRYYRRSSPSSSLLTITVVFQIIVIDILSSGLTFVVTVCNSKSCHVVFYRIDYRNVWHVYLMSNIENSRRRWCVNSFDAVKIIFVIKAECFAKLEKVNLRWKRQYTY